MGNISNILRLANIEIYISKDNKDWINVGYVAKGGLKYNVQAIKDNDINSQLYNFGYNVNIELTLLEVKSFDRYEKLFNNQKLNIKITGHDGVSDKNIYIIDIQTIVDEMNLFQETQNIIIKAQKKINKLSDILFIVDSSKTITNPRLDER